MDTPTIPEQSQMKNRLTTQKIVFISVGVFFIIALILGMYVTSRQQRSNTSAMSADQCTGDNKLIAEKCPDGYLPTDVIEAPKIETGGVVEVGAQQFCCVLIQEQPTTIPTLPEQAPTNAPPTEISPIELPKVTPLVPSNMVGSTPIIDVPNNPSVCRGPKPTLTIRCVSNCPPGAN